ncbi:hypothetical protein F4781DRAFT_433803 [Annulohypoxylon bovei var. microspora]|nr:hypothetical protein F4781DRAFT_433803 [Annulohypoxylon bovei var. microspora]
MAQGTVKPKKPSATSVSARRKAKPQPPKKGTRVTKAKRGSAADKMQKKFAAGLVSKTEKLLGERAGHLELIGKGRVKGGEKDGKGTTCGFESAFVVCVLARQSTTGAKVTTLRMTKMPQLRETETAVEETT